MTTIGGFTIVCDDYRKPCRTYAAAVRLLDSIDGITGAAACRLLHHIENPDGLTVVPAGRWADDHSMETTPCPNCGNLLNVHTEVEDDDTGSIYHLCPEQVGTRLRFTTSATELTDGDEVEGYGSVAQVTGRIYQSGLPTSKVEVLFYGDGDYTLVDVNDPLTVTR